MFCDRCGGAVQPGQVFCSKCGKPIVGPVAVMQSIPGRVSQHVQLLGILWLAMSAFNAVGGVILLVLANTLFAHLVPEFAGDCAGIHRSGQGVVRILRRVGIDAARALGACGRAGAGVRLAI
jgi:hypothetical protein